MVITVGNKSLGIEKEITPIRMIEDGEYAIVTEKDFFCMRNDVAKHETKTSYPSYIVYVDGIQANFIRDEDSFAIEIETN